MHKKAALKVVSVCPVQTENGWRIESIAKKGKYITWWKRYLSHVLVKLHAPLATYVHIYTLAHVLTTYVHNTVCKHLYLLKLLMGAAMTGMTEHDSEEVVIDDTADMAHDKEAVTSATTDEQASSLIKYLETNSTQVGPLKIKIEESLHNVLNMVCKCNEPSILETVKNTYIQPCP